MVHQSRHACRYTQSDTHRVARLLQLVRHQQRKQLFRANESRHVPAYVVHVRTHAVLPAGADCGVRVVEKPPSVDSRIRIDRIGHMQRPVHGTAVPHRRRSHTRVFRLRYACHGIMARRRIRLGADATQARQRPCLRNTADGPYSRTLGTDRSDCRIRSVIGVAVDDASYRSRSHVFPLRHCVGFDTVRSIDSRLHSLRIMDAGLAGVQTACHDRPLFLRHLLMALAVMAARAGRVPAVGCAICRSYTGGDRHADRRIRGPFMDAV